MLLRKRLKVFSRKLSFQRSYFRRKWIGLFFPAVLRIEMKNQSRLPLSISRSRPLRSRMCTNVNLLVSLSLLLPSIWFPNDHGDRWKKSPEVRGTLRSYANNSSVTDRDDHGAGNRGMVFCHCCVTRAIATHKSRDSSVEHPSHVSERTSCQTYRYQNRQCIR